jgi:hypothetical protein
VEGPEIKKDQSMISEKRSKSRPIAVRVKNPMRRVFQILFLLVINTCPIYFFGSRIILAIVLEARPAKSQKKLKKIFASEF